MLEPIPYGGTNSAFFATLRPSVSADRTGSVRQMHSFKEQLFRHRRHRHHLGGMSQSKRILIGSENPNFAVFPTERLQPLKTLLSLQPWKRGADVPVRN
jgi:hypothetical protein